MFRTRHVCVRQHDQADCGPAALATVAVHHRIPIGLAQMRELAGTDRAGTNLFGLVKAAEKIGFSARAAKGPPEALPEVPLPAIAHTVTKEGCGHFVVLHRVGRKDVVLADPAQGILRVPLSEFAKTWTGYVIVLAPSNRELARAAVMHSVGKFRRLGVLLSPLRAVLAETLLSALLMTVLGVSTSYFVKHLVDFVLVRGERGLLHALGVGMILVLVFRTAFGLLREYLLAHVGRRLDLELLSSYAGHVLRLPMRFFDSRQVGDILARLHDAGKIRDAVGGAALTALVDGTMVLVLFALLWVQDLPLALVSTAFVPLLLASVAFHHSPAQRRSRDVMENAARFSSHLVEGVGGIETVKALGIEGDRAEEGDLHLVRVVQSVFGLQMIRLRMGTAGAFLTALAGIVVLWFGGHRVLAGELSIGGLLLFYTLLGTLLDPLERLASLNLQIQDAMVAADRLFQVFEVPPELPETSQKVPFRRLERGIRFDRVVFSYGCRGNVLEDASLEIPSGSRVALVGESGSGKSTLLKLLLRFHEPSSGRIVVDGVDARDLDLESLRSRIGVVSQEPVLFTGTIRENIALGCPTADPGAVVEAARLAGLAKFIDGLPSRLDTRVGERGANLSGGQRQRLAIARALLRRPEILLFDEATSHLDSRTERAILGNLRHALGRTTIVMVAHRLSTIRGADRIYFLRRGRIAEQGTHEELLALGGHYARLWGCQMEEATRGPARIPGTCSRRFARGERLGEVRDA